MAKDTMVDIPNASETGLQAAENAFARIRKMFENAGATIEFRARRLKELAEFKGKKPFSYEGSVVYSEPLDFPDVQIRAIHEINLMTGHHAPAKQEISGPGGGAVQFSSLERANRLRYLIEKAKTLQAEAGVKKGE
jgi:hypothetical protein